VEKLVRSRVSVVGTALSNLIDFINPDMVVLGGGLVEAMPDSSATRWRKAVKAHASAVAASGVKVSVAKLHDHAGTGGRGQARGGHVHGTHAAHRRGAVGRQPRAATAVLRFARTLG
jgi:predicted NBD/HSP70 family sugar kinase